MSKSTILSPVASFEGTVEVIEAGADEIYCAVKMPGAIHILNRPDYCCVPTYSELGKIAAYAHEKGVETIITLELPFISEFMAEQMRNHITACVGEGIDALIVGDIGLIALIRDMGLDIPIYASTLLATMNYEAADFFRELGIKRVVLERHVSVEEIAQVVQRHQDLEIEIFVHGQGCSNINVNCYLEFARASSDAVDKVIGGIKGMVIPCRLPFEIYEYGDNEGQQLARLPVLDAFTFCSLCRVPELIDTGVVGLKIVGRCLPAAFQAQVTRMYRELVDLVQQAKGGFKRAHRRRFNRLLESLWEEPFRPESQSSDGSSHSPGSLREILCGEERCYYTPFFHAPYRASTSPSRGERGTRSSK